MTKQEPKVLFQTGVWNRSQKLTTKGPNPKWNRQLQGRSPKSGAPPVLGCQGFPGLIAHAQSRGPVSATGGSLDEALLRYGASYWALGNEAVLPGMGFIFGFRALPSQVQPGWAVASAFRGADLHHSWREKGREGRKAVPADREH